MAAKPEDRKPDPVPGLPGEWYATLEDAIEAWAHDKNKHGPQNVPPIRVYLGWHIQGWRVE